MSKRMFYVILLILLIFLLALAGAFLKTRNANTATENVVAGEEFIGESGELPLAGEKSATREKVYIGRQPPEDYVEPESNDPRQFEFQLALKDTYQSNVVIIVNELHNIDYEKYDWFNYTSELTPYSYGEAVQFVVYAILTYFDGNVPYEYYVNLDEDIHNRHPDSATILEVQTYGERPLNICIDMYNYRIRVEEGIKKID
ncbi:MAG: hypothetical protein FWG91_06410 [Lachnospiraceae bacterium]|nr:hypothetical protein [Lachnospiraceae bacterium]